jgi:hypothetical protein
MPNDRATAKNFFFIIFSPVDCVFPKVGRTNTIRAAWSLAAQCYEAVAIQCLANESGVICSKLCTATRIPNAAESTLLFVRKSLEVKINSQRVGWRENHRRALITDCFGSLQHKGDVLANVSAPTCRSKPAFGRKTH